jgi:hypothetical protein
VPLACFQRRHCLSVLPGFGANLCGRNGRQGIEVTRSMAAYRRYRAALRLALALAQCLNGPE